MGVSTLLIKWFYSFLSNRTQQVRVNGTLSEVKYSNTGVPQGCVSSPVLFALYTNDCRSTYTNNYIMKYADDTVILSLLHKDMDLSSYHSEIDTFIQWCDKKCLVLNVKKTQEMVLVPRSVSEHKPVIVKDTVIQQVTSYRYVGFYMNSVLFGRHILIVCAHDYNRGSIF